MRKKCNIRCHGEHINHGDHCQLILMVEKCTEKYHSWKEGFGEITMFTKCQCGKKFFNGNNVK